MKPVFVVILYEMLVLKRKGQFTFKMPTQYSLSIKIYFQGLHSRFM